MFVEEFLDSLAGGGISGPAEMRFQFKPIERRRVVAGGNHDATDGLLLTDGKRDSRRWYRGIAQGHLVPIADKNFGGDASELIR